MMGQSGWMMMMNVQNRFICGHSAVFAINTLLCLCNAGLPNLVVVPNHTENAHAILLRPYPLNQTTPINGASTTCLYAKPPSDDDFYITRCFDGQTSFASSRHILHCS
jgi:hypothetical protein